VPAAGHPGFVLGDDEIELGLGIHGERGWSARHSAGPTSLSTLS
jgi:dihydroxyacetone kinase